MDPVIAGLVVPLAGALIALVAGLIGVVVGGRMARKTTREQLAAQERQAELTRAREDRHRFTAEKRVIYAEFLVATDKFRDLVADTDNQIRQELDSLEEAYPAVALRDLHRNLSQERGYRELMSAKVDEITYLLSQLELIAPKKLHREADKLRFAVTRMSICTVDIWDPSSSDSYMAESFMARIELMKRMREDLGEYSSSE